MSEKYFFYFLFLAVSIGCFVVFAPYSMILIIAMALAVALYPLFDVFNRRVFKGFSGLSALITILICIVCIGVPLFFLGREVAADIRSMYDSFSMDALSRWIDSTAPLLKHMRLEEKIGEISSFVVGNILNFSSSLFAFVLSFILMLIGLFFFLRDGKRFVAYFKNISPLSSKHTEKIFSLLATATNGVVRGYLIVGAVQGLCMGIGLWIFGVPNALLWGVAAGIASIIPTIGTALVSIPAIIYLLTMGHTTAAIGLGIWAAVIVGTMDNLLNPMIVGKRLELPPLAILFAVLGGVALLGPAGILVGPLLAALFYGLSSIYKEDFKKPAENL